MKWFVIGAVFLTFIGHFYVYALKCTPAMVKACRATCATKARTIAQCSRDVEMIYSCQFTRYVCQCLNTQGIPMYQSGFDSLKTFTNFASGSPPEPDDKTSCPCESVSKCRTYCTKFSKSKVQCFAPPTCTNPKNTCPKAYKCQCADSQGAKLSETTVY